MDRIVIGMASFPPREKILRVALASLHDQEVDEIVLYLNEYAAVPSWLGEFSKVTPILGVDHGGDIGDAGKFWGVDAVQGYYFTCDDDVRYGGGYVAETIRGIEKYKRAAVVCHAGCTVAKASDGLKGVRSTGFGVVQPKPTMVHMPLTCLTAWHTSALDGLSPIRDFPLPNMADVWIGVFCQRAGVPIVCLSSKAHLYASIRVGESIRRSSIAHAVKHKNGSKADTSRSQSEVIRGVTWKWVNVPQTAAIRRHYEIGGEFVRAKEIPSDRQRKPQGNSVSVLITTCNRRDGLNSLLLDIERESASLRDSGVRLNVRVFDDASDENLAAASEILRRNGWSGISRRATRGGRDGYHGIVKDAFRAARDDNPSHVFFLQDDIRLCKSFFSRAMSNMGGHAVVMLLKDSRLLSYRAPQGEALRRGLSTVKIPWMDMAAFVASRDAMDTWGWSCEGVKRFEAGSGVGPYLGRKILASGKSIGQVSHSLVVHVEGPSRMHPQLRKKMPLSTVDYVDGENASCEISGLEFVTASLCSIPSRHRELREVVGRLLKQVNQLNVYLNGYKEMPPWLSHPRIDVRIDPSNKMGDARKFDWCEEVVGVHLICDDDILYPQDFTARMVASLREYERAIVGVHGVIMVPPISSYYKCRKVFHFAHALEQDTPVHIVGTNMACYDASAVEVRKADFKHPNMADIWLGLIAQRQGVPVVAVKREAGWARDIPTTRADSIYARESRSDRVQTEAANSVEWKINTPSPRDVSEKVVPIAPTEICSDEEKDSDVGRADKPSPASDIPRGRVGAKVNLAREGSLSRMGLPNRVSRR